ncbi:MAG: uracil-DNA glycosylase [Phycisphaerales bacterium]|nr:uracil-DNA glycosylase [Phycisphaerales bacterium]
MDPDARQLIAQHAETARLLGVDFLPLGNPPAIEHPHEPEPVTRSDSPAPAPSFAPSLGVSSAEIRAAYESIRDPQQRLDALRAKYELDAPHASFAQGFNKIVFGEGDPCARLMFIGEAPGQEEDASGRPFVGRAGQLLEKMIVAMGLSRETVYICNVLKTRPPNNATPTTQESELCAPYLYEQIRIVKPEAIVTLGLPATRTVLKAEGSMGSMRGRWHAFPPKAVGEIEGLGSVPVMPTYHPAYLLRSYTEDNRRKVWSDLQQVQQRLGLKP